MILTSAQSQIAKDLHRFRVLNCGRRFGKTILAIEEMVGIAFAKKDRRVAYFAPTRDDAREITWSMLIKKCESIITYKNESLLQIKIMTQDKGESMIALYGWESVQERGKGRGLANDFIVLDEVSSYRNFWIGWNEVLSPTLIDRRGSAMFISTPKGFNHFHDLYNMELKDKDYKSFYFTSYDNPHIPKEEIDRERISKPDNVFGQEYLAQFTKMEGLVYREFSREYHLFETVESMFYEVIAGVDFGYTNPAAVYSIGIDHSGKYYIFEEFYRTQRTDVEIAEYVASKRYNKVYPDPEAAGAIEEMKRRGVNVREVIKGKDSIKNGIDIVREFLKAGQLFVHISCINLINEFEMYSYPEKKDGKNESELPVDEYNHGLDAIRYAIVMHSTSKAIDQVHQHTPSWVTRKR